MKMTETVRKEVKEPVISEREAMRLKELVAAPKETGRSGQEANRIKLEKADSMLEKRLDNQKEVPKNSKEIGADHTEKTVFKHSLDDKINKGGDISFGSGCVDFCKKTVTNSTGARHSGR